MLSSSSYIYPFQSDNSGKFSGKLSGNKLCQLNWPPESAGITQPIAHSLADSCTCTATTSQSSLAVSRTYVMRLIAQQDSSAFLYTRYPSLGYISHPRLYFVHNSVYIFHIRLYLASRSHYKSAPVRPRIQRSCTRGRRERKKERRK